MNQGMSQPPMMTQQYQRNPNSDSGRGARGGYRGGRGGYNQGPPVQQQMNQVRPSEFSEKIGRTNSVLRDASRGTESYGHGTRLKWKIRPLMRCTRDAMLRDETRHQIFWFDNPKGNN